MLNKLGLMEIKLFREKMKFITLLLITILFSISSNASELENLIKEDYKAYSDSLENNITSLTLMSDGKNTKTFLLSNKEEELETPIFQIGSVSKLFVAHALVSLVESGDLKLSTNLKSIMPYAIFKDTNIANITLLQLANHTSGLPRLPINIFVGQKDSLQPYENYTNAMLLNFLSNYELVRKPGSSYEYSNLGFGALGNSLDIYLRKNKKISLDDYIKTELFDKIGMNDTGLKLTTEQQSREVQPYMENTTIPAWNFDVLKWAGAYYSTSEDLAKYLNQFVTKTPILSDKVLEKLRQITFEANKNMRMSLGWHITPLNKTTVFWHNGNTYGNSAFIGYTTDGKFISILSNSNRILDNVAVDILSNMK